MPSPFESRMSAVGFPVGQRHSGETVTFTDNSFVDLEITDAIVELNEPQRDHTEGFEPTIFTGQILVNATDRLSILNSGNPYLTVTAKNHDDWHVVDVGDVINGKATVGIRREDPEHSNGIDLQGNQHRYG